MADEEDRGLPPAKRVKTGAPASDEEVHVDATPNELELGSDVLPHVKVAVEHTGHGHEVDTVTAERQLVGDHHSSHPTGNNHHSHAAEITEPRKTPATSADASNAKGGDGIGAAGAADVGAGVAVGGSATVEFTLSEKTRQIMQDEARHLDFWEWLDKFGALPFNELFKVFDYELPEALKTADPDDLLPLLKAVMMKKIAKRPKRQDINTIEQVVELLMTCKNIVVLTGAGVSVSCGIPDFRSKNGIYSRLDEFDLDDPQQMFDIQYFRIQPKTFYTFAKEIYPSNFRPSPSHMFIKLLEEKGKLLRNYTQNIDTIEQLAGIERVVQCHGSFATAKCIVCGYTTDGTALKEDIFNQTVPMCPKCPEEKDGIMKPGITFFGEMLPDEFDRLFAQDREKVDLLIVMGSSLKVSPVADVKDKIPHHVPQVLINMESLPHMAGFDVQLLGYCDNICAQLCSMLDWKLEHPKIQLQPAANPPRTPETGQTESSTISSTPQYRQGHVPHHYLFEGAITAAEMDLKAYIPSDREDSSGTSSDDDDDSSGGEDGDSESGDHVVEFDGIGHSDTDSPRTFPSFLPPSNLSLEGNDGQS